MADEFDTSLAADSGFGAGVGAGAAEGVAEALKGVDLSNLPEVNDSGYGPLANGDAVLFPDQSQAGYTQGFGPWANRDVVMFPDQSQAGYTGDTPIVDPKYASLISKIAGEAGDIVGKAVSGPGGTQAAFAQGAQQGAAFPTFDPSVVRPRGIADPDQLLGTAVKPVSSGSGVIVVAAVGGVVLLGGVALLLSRRSKRRRAK